MRARRILLAVALLAACRDSTGTPVPAEMRVMSGNGQAATVGEAAPLPLIAGVLDADGDPVAGVTVQWAVSSGGGSISAASGQTDADGLARVHWTLGTRAEAQTVTATVEGLSPVVFTITPAPGPFVRIAITPDSVDLTAVGELVVLRPSYTDAYGNSTGQPAPVVWTSLDQAVVRIDLTTNRELLALALSGGRARVVARTRNEENTRNVADTAIVWVRQRPASINVILRDTAVIEGDTTRARAEVRDAGGALIPNPALTWSTTDPAAASIDATGKVTTLRGGTPDVVATVGTLTGAARLRVSGLFRVASLDAGGHHSCALNAAGQAYCWGWNQAGQLGVPFPFPDADRWAAVPAAVETSARFTAIAASAFPDPHPEGVTWAYQGHSCGIATNAALLCWGENWQGQLGTQGTPTHLPAEVLGGRSWAAVSAGGRHTCGITTGGQTYCWGLDDEGQLGAATTERCRVHRAVSTTGACATTPQPVQGGLTFTRISAGTAHTCALTAGGAAYCWGRNISGQLGNGTTTQAEAPVAVLGGHAFVEISAGGGHTCARTAAGAVYCWGANDHGQLGNGTTTQATAPVALPGSGRSVQAGWAHSCALGSDGKTYCWGANAAGQRGSTILTSAPWPTEVQGGFSFASISTAGFHTCAVRTADGAAMCWGENYIGKLGSGPGPNRPSPGLVRAP